MNKKQIIVLGIGVLLICSIILIAPKYVYVPYRATLLSSEFPYLANKHEQKISWDWVIQYSLPVISIAGFLMLLFKGPVQFPVIRLPKLPGLLGFPRLPVWSLWFILIIVFIVSFIIFSMVIAVILHVKLSEPPKTSL